MKNNILIILAYITLILAIGLVGVLSFWQVYPYKVIEFKSVALVKTEYKAGENLDLMISHCKYLPLPATMIRQFRNDVIYSLPSNQLANSPVGCRTMNSIDIKIPVELPAGEYTYRQTMIYKVNPIREISVVIETPKFRVIE